MVAVIKLGTGDKEMGRVFGPFTTWGGGGGEQTLNWSLGGACVVVYFNIEPFPCP